MIEKLEFDMKRDTKSEKNPFGTDNEDDPFATVPDDDREWPREEEDYFEPDSDEYF